VNHKTLKRKLKLRQTEFGEIHTIRIHRAISWLKAAEENENTLDLKFICLWISCNSLYAIDNIQFEKMKERERFADFVDRLVELDIENRLYNALWNKFSQPIRLLVDNQFVYEPYWNYVRGDIFEWEKGFKKQQKDAYIALSEKNVGFLFRIILDRLYALRNQLIHGGSTFKSKVNRFQVKDGISILSFVLPIMIDIMLDNPQENWGMIYYPPVS
jgi:hypothetical protein